MANNVLGVMFLSQRLLCISTSALCLYVCCIYTSAVLSTPLYLVWVRAPSSKGRGGGGEETG